MNFYDYDEIKQAADCVEICENVLSMTRESESSGWVMFNCPWRPGSDSGSFAVKKEGWFDHVAKEGGSVLDLVNKTKFDGCKEVVPAVHGLFCW